MIGTAYLLGVLIALPIVLLLYLWLMKRRKKSALRYANLSLVKEAMGKGGAWRRHVPPLLFLVALTLMLLAIARPAAIVTLPLSASNWMKVRCFKSVRPFHLFVARGTGVKSNRASRLPSIKAGVGSGGEGRRF